MDISYDNPRWKLCSHNHYSHPKLDICKNATMKVHMVHPQALQMVKSTLHSSWCWLLSQLGTMPMCHSCPNPWMLIWQTFKWFCDRVQTAMTPCICNWWRNIAYLLSLHLYWSNQHLTDNCGTIYIMVVSSVYSICRRRESIWFDQQGGYVERSEVLWSADTNCQSY